MRPTNIGKIMSRTLGKASCRAVIHLQHTRQGSFGTVRVETVSSRPLLFSAMRSGLEAVIVNKRDIDANDEHLPCDVSEHIKNNKSKHQYEKRSRGKKCPVNVVPTPMYPSPNFCILSKSWNGWSMLLLSTARGIETSGREDGEGGNSSSLDRRRLPCCRTRANCEIM